jgi:hypothetical protein
MSRESESTFDLRSNPVAARSCSESSLAAHSYLSPEITARSCSEISGWFATLARNLWSTKPAATLQYLVGIKERTSHAYVSGAREPPASLLVALLRGADCARVLDHVMAGSAAPWWHELRRARIVAAAFDRARVQVDEQLQLGL